MYVKSENDDNFSKIWLGNKNLYFYSSFKYKLQLFYYIILFYEKNLFSLSSKVSEIDDTVTYSEK